MSESVLFDIFYFINRKRDTHAKMNILATPNMMKMEKFATALKVDVM